MQRALAWGWFALKGKSGEQRANMPPSPLVAYHGHQRGGISPIDAGHATQFMGARNGMGYLPRSAGLPPHLARIHTQLSPIPSAPGSPVGGAGSPMGATGSQIGSAGPAMSSAHLTYMHRTFGIPSPVAESPVSTGDPSPQPLSPLAPQYPLIHHGQQQYHGSSMWPVSPQSFDEVHAPQPRRYSRKKSLGARLAERMTMRAVSARASRRSASRQPQQSFGVPPSQVPSNPPVDAHRVDGDSGGGRDAASRPPPRRRRSSILASLGFGGRRRVSLLDNEKESSIFKPRRVSKTSTMGRQRKSKGNTFRKEPHQREASLHSQRFSSRSTSLAVGHAPLWVRVLPDQAARTLARPRLFRKARGSSLEREREMRRDLEATAGLLADSDSGTDSEGASVDLGLPPTPREDERFESSPLIMEVPPRTTTDRDLSYSLPPKRDKTRVSIPTREVDGDLASSDESECDREDSVMSISVSSMRPSHAHRSVA